MFSQLPDSLPALVKSKYKAATANSSVIYSPSELALIRLPSGATVRSPNPKIFHMHQTQQMPFQFQLRFCPSLAKKPGAEPAAADPKKKFDPFDHPSGDLYIGEIGHPRGSSSYVLVLNKFAIVANHFILATKEFKPQTDPLEPEDLEATFACLNEWENATAAAADRTTARPGRLFAFFNSGVWSGASQAHRHVQLLPVEDMRGGDGDGDEWRPLIDCLADKPGKTSAVALCSGSEFCPLC
jgi:sulfate adenylyltransferase (ADP) / ATP adenylyltransferase